MFRGINNISLDAKGRIAIPTRYRDSLYEASQGSLVLTIHHDEKCLWMITMDEWLAMEKKLIALPSLNSQTQRLKRLLIGHATEVEMDKNSRVLISPPLRKFAQFNKNLVLIGQGNKFELWDEAIWNNRRDDWLNVQLDDDSLSIDLESLSL